MYLLQSCITFCTVYNKGSCFLFLPGCLGPCFACAVGCCRGWEGASGWACGGRSGPRVYSPSLRACLAMCPLQELGPGGGPGHQGRAALPLAPGLLLPGLDVAVAFTKPHPVRGSI